MYYIQWMRTLCCLAEFSLEGIVRTADGHQSIPDFGSRYDRGDVTIDGTCTGSSTKRSHEGEAEKRSQSRHQ